MALDILFSGAISAVFGAVALHTADGLVERRRFAVAVHTELLENQQKLASEIKRMQEDARWDSAMTNKLRKVAFETLKVSNPSLFLKLTGEIDSLQSAYIEVDKRISEYDAVNQPGASFNATQDEVMQAQIQSILELQIAVREFEEYVKDSWLRRTLYSPVLEDEGENLVDIEDLSELQS